MRIESMWLPAAGSLECFGFPKGSEGGPQEGKLSASRPDQKQLASNCVDNSVNLLGKTRNLEPVPAQCWDVRGGD